MKWVWSSILMCGLTMVITSGCGGSNGSNTRTTPSPTSPSPPVSPAPTAPSNCFVISASGKYVLSNDLSSNSAGCLTVKNSASVDVDCANHRVSTIVVTGSQSVSIENCAQDEAPATVWCPASAGAALNLNAIYSLDIQNSSGVNVTNSALGCGRIYKSRQVNISNSHLTGDWHGLNSSTVTLANNRVDQFGILGVGFDSGDHNVISSNQIIGGWDGRPCTGSPLFDVSCPDDAVIISNEQNDSFTDNTIQNVYDAGIESTASLLNSSIARNTFSNTGVTSIGTYYSTSWDGNSVSQNTASSSPRFMYVTYAAGDTRGGIPIAALGFRNVVIDGNHLLTMPASIYLNLAGLDVSNNRISNNDFGAAAGPVVTPVDGFVDGGGNACSHVNAGNLIVCR